MTCTLIAAGQPRHQRGKRTSAKHVVESGTKLGLLWLELGQHIELHCKSHPDGIALTNSVSIPSTANLMIYEGVGCGVTLWASVLAVVEQQFQPIVEAH